MKTSKANLPFAVASANRRFGAQNQRGISRQIQIRRKQRDFLCIKKTALFLKRGPLAPNGKPVALVCLRSVFHNGESGFADRRDDLLGLHFGGIKEHGGLLALVAGFALQNSLYLRQGFVDL